LTGVRIDALESLRISNVGIRSGDSVFVSCTKPDVSFLATGAVEYRDAISTLFGKGEAIKTGITTQNINRNLPILTASNPTKTTLYVSNANQSKERVLHQTKQKSLMIFSFVLVRLFVLSLPFRM
jgi:hypothetical protein